MLLLLFQAEAQVEQPRRLLRSRQPRRWRPLPEIVETLPPEVKAELPKVSPAELTREIVAAFRSRVAEAARVEAAARQIALEAENRRAEALRWQRAMRTLERAEMALAEAEAAAEAHMARLRNQQFWMMAA